MVLLSAIASFLYMHHAPVAALWVCIVCDYLYLIVKSLFECPSYCVL